MPLALELHVLPDPWNHGNGPSVATDGEEIVWPIVDTVTDAGPLVPDIAVFAPGTDTEPHIFYRHPDRDSIIWSVAVREGRYAFLEANTRELGESGWRLWVIPRAGAGAILLDTRDGDVNDPRPSPSFVLTRDGIAWTAVHDREGKPTFELRTATFEGADSRALLSAAVSERQFWYPSTDASGTRLLYATVEPSGTAYAFRTWSLDLTTPAAAPVRVGNDDAATDPVSNGRVSAWRTVDTNVSNWSPALVVDGSDGSAPVSVATTGATDVTIGNRFVAFNAFEEQELVLYDIEARRMVTVERYSPPETRSFQSGWTVVAGDLLVFRRVDSEEGGTKPEVVWARLPHAGE